VGEPVGRVGWGRFGFMMSSNQVADRLSGGLVRIMREREVFITMSSREGMASIDYNAQPSCERGGLDIHLSRPYAEPG
jgi:hypothetical protein